MHFLWFPSVHSKTHNDVMGKLHKRLLTHKMEIVLIHAGVIQISSICLTCWNCTNSSVGCLVNTITYHSSSTEKHKSSVHPLALLLWTYWCEAVLQQKRDQVRGLKDIADVSSSYVGFSTNVGPRWLGNKYGLFTSSSDGWSQYKLFYTPRVLVFFVELLSHQSPVEQWMRHPFNK